MKYYSYIVCLGFVALLSLSGFAQEELVEPKPEEAVSVRASPSLTTGKGEEPTNQIDEKNLSAESGDKASIPKVLKLKNGDILPAEWKQFIPTKKSLTGNGHPARLLVGSELLLGDVELDIQALDSLELGGMRKDAAGFALIQLSNGTHLWGNLLNIKDDHIEVDTIWAGKIALKKKMVEAIDMRSPSTFFCIGTDDLKDWKQTQTDSKSESSLDVSDAWYVENGCFVSTGSAWRRLYRSLELTDKIKTELRLHYNGYNLRTVISLWADQGSDESRSSNALVLEIQSGYCQLYVNSSQNGRISLGTCRFKVSYHSSKEETLDLAFYADKKARKFILFINGQRVGSWQGDDISQNLDNGPTQNLEKSLKDWKGGNYVSFEVSGVPVKMSHLSVSRWRGGDPTMILKSTAELPVSMDAKDENKGSGLTPSNEKQGKEVKKGEKAQIQLVNGDTVVGEILEIATTNIRIRTPEYTVNIPINRTLGLNLGGLEDASDRIQRLYANDVRLELVDKSNVILDLRGFDGTCLTGFSESTGLVKMKPEFIRKIFFNVHDAKGAEKSNAKSAAKRE